MRVTGMISIYKHKKSFYFLLVLEAWMSTIIFTWNSFKHAQVRLNFPG